MDEALPELEPLASGELPFTVESRLLRELGERLVRQPEVALLELVKNASDADAGRCRIAVQGNDGCCAAIKVRTPVNQDEKVFCRLQRREGEARPEAQTAEQLT